MAARKAARDFVLDGPPADLAAVAVYSVEKGVRMLVTFTLGPAQLASAIETLGLEAPRAPGIRSRSLNTTPPPLHFGTRPE